MNIVINNIFNDRGSVLIYGRECRQMIQKKARVGTVTFVDMCRFAENSSVLSDGWYNGKGTVVVKPDHVAKSNDNKDYWYPIHLIRKSEVEAFYDYYVTMVIHGFEIEFWAMADSYLWNITEIFPEYVVLAHSGYTLELTDIQKEILKTIPQSEVIEKSGGSYYDGFNSYTFIPKKYIEKIILRRRYLKTDNIEKSLKKEYTGKEDVYELDLKNPDPDILNLMMEKRVVVPFADLSVYADREYFKAFVEKYNIKYQVINGFIFMRYNDYVIMIRMLECNNLAGDCSLFCAPSDETVYDCPRLIWGAGRQDLDLFLDNEKDVAALKLNVFGCAVDSEEYKKKHKDTVESKFVEIIYLLDRFIYGNDKEKIKGLEVFKKTITVNKEFYRVHKSEFDQFLNGKQLDKSDNK